MIIDCQKENETYIYYMFCTEPNPIVFYSFPFSAWDYDYMLTESHKEFLNKQNIKIVKITSDKKLYHEHVRFVLEIFLETINNLSTYLKNKVKNKNEESLF